MLEAYKIIYLVSKRYIRDPFSSVKLYTPSYHTSTRTQSLYSDLSNQVPSRAILEQPSSMRTTAFAVILTSLLVNTVSADLHHSGICYKKVGSHDVYDSVATHKACDAYENRN